MANGRLANSEWRAGFYSLLPTRYSLLWIVVLHLAVLFSAWSAQVFKESEVKAVFLFNFTQFVEWPQEAFATPDAPFVIGVLGTNPFGDALEQAVRSEKVGHRPLKVEYYARPRDIGACQVLYIAPSESARAEQVLAFVSKRPILTVGEGETFLRQGGILRFVTGRRVSLKINLDAAKAAKLKISSKLLRVAEIDSK